MMWTANKVTAVMIAIACSAALSAGNGLAQEPVSVGQPLPPIISAQRTMTVVPAVGCQSAAQPAVGFSGCQQPNCPPAVIAFTGQNVMACTGNGCCQSRRCGACRLGGCWQNWWQKDIGYFQYSAQVPCPGDRLNGLLNTQITNGHLAQQAFYGFHFNLDQQTREWGLSDAGLNNLQRIARIWQWTPGTILVEPTGIAEADTARLTVVQESLLNAGFPEDVKVELGRSVAFGLKDVEAAQIYQQRLMNRPLQLSNTGRSASQDLSRETTMGQSGSATGN